MTLEELAFGRIILLLGRRLRFLKEALCTLGSQDPGGLLLGDPASGQLFVNHYSKFSKDFTYLCQSEMSSYFKATERTTFGIQHIRNGILSFGWKPKVT